MPGTSIDLDVSAFIPDNYILNEDQKLEIYKRIASIENQTECDEMKDELIDRFGEVPETALNLLRISLLRARAHELYIIEVKGGNGSIEIKISPSAKIDPGKIPGFIASYKGNMAFHSTGIPVFVYKYKKDPSAAKAEKQLLEDAESIIDKLKELRI